MAFSRFYRPFILLTVFSFESCALIFFHSAAVVSGRPNADFTPVSTLAPTATRTKTEKQDSFPSALDLIASDDSTKWTKLVDLTCRLPPEVQSFNKANPDSKITLLGKCEFSNPGMSHKDRIAKAMLMAAEKRGDLTAPDGTKKTILAASSGNTGCSLALIGTLMGYEVVVITNAKCSMEKRVHIQSNGATLWMAEELPDQFPTEIGTEGDYIKQEDLLAAAFPDRFYSVNQYANPDNAAAHFGSTGREIWEQTKGRVTHFVMAGSTGGTIMGVGQYLKEQARKLNKGGKRVEVVLADPEKSHLHALVHGRIHGLEAGSQALTGVDALIEATGEVQVEGAGKTSLTGIMAAGEKGAVLKHVDYAISVNDFDAFEECRATAQVGFLVGGSSGLNICAAQAVARRCALEEPPRKGGVTIVTLLCDHGIKYLSKVYNKEWLEEHDTRGK